MVRKYELEVVGRPDPTATAETTLARIADETAKSARLIVGAELGLAGMFAAIEVLGIPGIIETFATGGRGGRIVHFMNETVVGGIGRAVEKMGESSFYNAYADTNLLRGLAKGMLIGQADTAVTAVMGAEGGALVGAIIGSFFSPGGTVAGALLGAKIGAVVYPFITELGVVSGALDRIRAGFGAEGPLARLGMRRVSRTAPTVA